MEQPKLQSSDRFLEWSTTALGGLMGFLIAVPLSTTSASPGAALAAVVFLPVFGVIAGYRRRKSRVFFYFCLGGVIMLSLLISFALVEPPAAP